MSGLLAVIGLRSHGRERPVSAIINCTVSDITPKKKRGPGDRAIFRKATGPLAFKAWADRTAGRITTGCREPSRCRSGRRRTSTFSAAWPGCRRPRRRALSSC